MTTSTLLLLALAIAAPASSPARPAPGPRTHKVDIRAFAVQPARLEVAAGDKVEWTNRDIVPHTATSADGSWDAGELAGGRSGSVVVAKAGTFDYFCRFHPSMKGALVVAAPGR